MEQKKIFCENQRNLREKKMKQNQLKTEAEKRLHAPKPGCYAALQKKTCLTAK